MSRHRTMRSFAAGGRKTVAAISAVCKTDCGRHRQRHRAQSRVNDVTELRNLCRKTAEEHRQPVLVERFLPGREFTVGILGSGNKATALATVEIVLLDGRIPKFTPIATRKSARNWCNTSCCRQAAEASDRSARATGLARARLPRRWPHRYAPGRARSGAFLEVNPLAGMHPEHSDLPIMATLAGMSYRRADRRDHGVCSGASVQPHIGDDRARQ